MVPSWVCRNSLVTHLKSRSWTYFVVMLYAVIMRFDSLREIMPSIQAEARKLCHFSNILFKGVERHPKTGKKKEVYF